MVRPFGRLRKKSSLACGVLPGRGGKRVVGHCEEGMHPMVFRTHSVWRFRLGDLFLEGWREIGWVPKSCGVAMGAGLTAGVRWMRSKKMVFLDRWLGGAGAGTCRLRSGLPVFAKGTGGRGPLPRGIGHR